MKEQKNWAYGVSINGVGTIFYSREYFTREGIVNPLTAEPYTKNEINAIEKALRGTQKVIPSTCRKVPFWA